MENRIKIGDVWYVREDQIQDKPITLNPIKTEGIIVENSDFCFEATRIFTDDGISFFKDGVDIKFIDKRSKPFTEDYWDGNTWMRGVLNNDPNSIDELPDNMGENDIKYFQAFLQYLKDEEWL
jgi:hypothetical protein